MARRRNNRANAKLYRQVNLTTNNTQPRNPRPPRVRSFNGMTRVSGSEQVQTVTNTSTGNVAISFDLNPLNMGTTWLQRQAQLFNKYKYVKAVLRFVPVIPTSTPGRILMAFDSDVLDTNPSTANAVSQFQGSRECPIWMTCQVSMAPGRKPEYTSNVAAGSTENTPGRFLIWSDYGPAGTATVGVLYLDYEVDFWSRASPSANQ